MSLRVEGLPAALGVFGLLVGSTGQAQTIADYSRAQRAVLESAMTQAAARSAGLAAPASPASAASAPVAAVAAMPSMPPRVVLPSPVAAVHVNGVFSVEGAAVAEVLVNAAPYLLSAGQAVPGTSWRVESVSTDRVVIARAAAAGSLADGEGTRKVFALPALR